MVVPRIKKRSHSRKIEATPMDVEEKDNNRDRKHILNHLSRAPGKCILSNCNQLVFPSNMLVHMLRKHNNSPNTNLAIIYDNQRLRKTFNLNSLKYDEPQVLNILLYAGTEGKPHTRPARRYLSYPNCGLPHSFGRYEHHLMMNLMICKTSWFSMLPDRICGEKLEKMHGTPENTLYVIWLMGPETSSRMFYTLTAYDRYYIQSRSVIRKTRNFFLSQQPKDFLNHENDYLMLRHEEAMDLMNGEGDELNQTSYIQLELFLHEEPKLVSFPTHLFPTPMMSDTIRIFPLSFKAINVLPPKMMTKQNWKRAIRMSRKGPVAATKTAKESNDTSDDQEYSFDSKVKIELLKYLHSVRIPKAKRTQKQVQNEDQAKPLEMDPVLLEVPIKNRVLKTFKNAMDNSVKDAVRKVTDETLIANLDITSELELELEIKPRNRPAEAKTEAKNETEAPQ
uniref:CG12681-PA n=2 Tax=Drosophila melanogaster TaxID=7227 RepID=B4F4Z0_DROME|nr:CG12681-PA [Drosophila melanogaster]